MPLSCPNHSIPLTASDTMAAGEGEEVRASRARAAERVRRNKRVLQQGTSLYVCTQLSTASRRGLHGGQTSWSTLARGSPSSTWPCAALELHKRLLLLSDALLAALRERKSRPRSATRPPLLAAAPPASDHLLLLLLLHLRAQDRLWRLIIAALARSGARSRAQWAWIGLIAIAVLWRMLRGFELCRSRCVSQSIPF